MRRTAALTVLVGVALLAAGFYASTASATVLCKTNTNPCTGGTYAKGTTIEASLKAGTSSELDGTGVACNKSSLKGSVTDAGGSQTDVSGFITSFNFEGCNAQVWVTSPGTFTIETPSGGNGLLVLEGLKVTVAIKGMHCVYSGPVQIFLKGGGMSSIGPVGTLFPYSGESGCANLVGLTADYTVTAPEPLYVEKKPTTSTVLCKTATNPCTGGTYGKGTTVEASLKAGTESVLHPTIGSIGCSSSSIKGEVTNTGGESSNVSGIVNSWSFTECNATVHVLKKGTFTINSPSGGDGVLVLEGFEATVGFAGFHCIFSGPVLIPLKGGAMASIGTTATVPRTGGSSGIFCGSTAPWTVDYTVTAPEPLYAEEKAESIVLCKTNTNPCTGGTYGAGTMIEANLTTGTKSFLHPPIGTIECSSSSIKGEETNSGGEGANVTGTILNWSFSSCNATVHVLKQGTFTIKSPEEGNGTLVLKGFEITVAFAGFHCIFSGPVSIPLKGGAMASIGAGAKVPRTGGTSELFCGSTAQWTVDYTVTAPEPLWVAET